MNHNAVTAVTAIYARNREKTVAKIVAYFNKQDPYYQYSALFSKKLNS